jgi:WhiB family redox-sensing transcriptional regulator
MQHAACREADVAIFYPKRGESTEPALDYCRRCPVAEQCLDHALDSGDKFGVWALPERARRKVRRARRIARLDTTKERSA